MQATPKSVESIRELLRYILQEFQAKGGHLTLPVGCYHLEDWLLDAVDTSTLLQLLQTERDVNLVQACKGSAASGPSAEPGPLAQGVLHASRDAPVEESAPSPAKRESDCDLQLPLPSTGLRDAELKDLAYTVFVGCCSAHCTELLTDDVRRSLQISQDAATSLETLLGEAARRQRQAASSLEMVVMLLQIARPRHFAGFEEFGTWRRSSSAVVCQSLALGAAEAASGDTGPTPSIRRELQRLRMAARMLDVAEPEEFDEAVYAEAAEAFVTAAAGVAGASGLSWGLPWPIRVRIAELLMAAGLGGGGAGGEPIPEQKQLMYLLRHHLWPLLGLPVSLHDLLHAWAYLRQFALTATTALLTSCRDLFEAIRQRRRGPINGRRASAQAPGDEESFLDYMIAAAVDWVASRLGNYRQHSEDSGPIPGLLDVLVACLKCLGRQEEVPEILERCIAASVRAEVERALRELASRSSGVPKDADRIVAISRACSEILDEEVAYYAPLFSGHVKRPAELAAIKVHECLNRHLLPWLRTVHTLEDSNLEAIRESVGLESKLQTLIGERVSKPLDWAILERLTPLLHLWVSNQLSLVQSWYERIFSTESWQPVSQPRGCSRSAVELVKIVRETLEALFDLHLGLPDEVVSAAGMGLDKYLQRYAQQTAAELGSPDFMVPPVPALTRYKKEVAIKAAAADSGAPATPVRHSRNSSSATEAGPRGTPEQELLANGPAAPLIVRMNSLHYIRSHLTTLSEIITSRWGSPEDEGVLWAEGVFDSTRAAVAHSIDRIILWLSMKGVHRDLAAPVAAVYKHEVVQSRIGPLLEALDDELGTFCSTAEPDLHGLLARGLLGAALDALLRVLLHGGPHRWYKPGDVPLIEEDMEDLRALFHADGAGLEEADIRAMCASVDDLLTVLELDTAILIANLKQVRQQEKSGRPPGKQALAYDSQILLHVLAHREDHAASKYLKKEFALPKKLDGHNPLTSGLSSLSSGRHRREGSGLGKRLTFGSFGRRREAA